MRFWALEGVCLFQGERPMVGIIGKRTSSVIRASLLVGVSSVAIGAMVARQPVVAEEGDNVALEEITVTAQRREQSLKDVPTAITAFSSMAIERNMFQGISEYLGRTPNVSFTTSGGRDRKNISIRGITNFLGSGSNVQTIGFYIDDFSVGGGTVNPPIMDIERIEVLRGPQGTYFGRNAVGGAINITTKKPDNEWYGETIVGYSSFDTKDVEGVLNIPLVTDTLAVRGGIKWRSTDGNIRNIHPIGGGNHSEYINGKIALRFTPTNRLTLDLIGSLTHEDSGMREGVPSGVFSDFTRDVLFGYLNNQPDPDGVGFYPDNTNRVNFNRPQSVGANFKYVTGKVTYDFDHITLTSISGYIDSRSFLEGDIDGGSTDAFYEVLPVNRSSFSQELRIQSSGPGDWDWTFGGHYSHDKGNVNQSTFAGSENSFGFPEGFVVTRTLSNNKSDAYAVFGELGYHMTPRLLASVGARFTHEKSHSGSARFSGPVVSHFIDETASFSDFSPRFALNYTISDEVTTYATVSKGFKAGGVQTDPLLPEKAYKPEHLWNYELGAKTDLLDRRLRINTSLFYMKWTNLQTNFRIAIIDANGNIAFVTGIENAQSARSYGAEIEATAALTRYLTINASAGYLNAKYQKFMSFVGGSNIPLDGMTIPNAPRWTLGGDIEYHRPVLTNFDGFIRAEWNYRSGIVPEKDMLIESGFPYEVPGYNHVNLRLGLENAQYRFVGYIENLFDANYYTNAYEKAFIGGYHVEPSKQVFGFRFTYKTG